MKRKKLTSSGLSQSELELKIWKAERFNKLREAYLSYMLQNIRTQMNNITGFSKLLVDEEGNPEKRGAYYEQIETSTDKLNGLLSESLDIAMMSLDKIDIKKEPCYINHLMDDLYSYFSQQKKLYSKAYVEIYMYADVEDEDFNIIGDCSRVRQIMAQLIGNCLSNCSDGDELEFGYRILKEGKSRLMLYVEDNASEYTREELDAILKEPQLYQESLTQDLKMESVDFMVLRTMIDFLDGEMDIITGEEKGIRYEISLPYKPGEKKQEVPDDELNMEEMPSVFEWADYKILIAEDVESNYYLLESALEETNAQVLHAKNGEEAVKIYKENPDIHIILMDIKMPVMDGLEATEMIKKINPEVPIIAQTAFVVDFDKNAAMEAGCDDFVSKPLNFESLFKTMDLYLKNTL